MSPGSCRRLATCAVLTVAALLTSLGTARADYTLTLHEAGYTDQTISYSGSALPGQPAYINYVGGFGGFAIVVEVSTSTSNLPNSLPTLTINNLELSTTAGSPQTLQITVQDTGFSNQSVGTGPVSLISQLSTTQVPTGSGVTYQSFLNGNAGNQLSLNSVGGAQDTTLLTSVTNPFTLKSVTTVTVSGMGVIQTSGITLVQAPEPATMGAAFSMVPVLAAGLWWKRRKQA
jgi:hypothetical protein